jgi:hypothetical protein
MIYHSSNTTGIPHITLALHPIINGLQLGKPLRIIFLAVNTIINKDPTYFALLSPRMHVVIHQLHEISCTFDLQRDTVVKAYQSRSKFASSSKPGHFVLQLSSPSLAETKYPHIIQMCTLYRINSAEATPNRLKCWFGCNHTPIKRLSLHSNNYALSPATHERHDSSSVKSKFTPPMSRSSLIRAVHHMELFTDFQRGRPNHITPVLSIMKQSRPPVAQRLSHRCTKLARQDFT